MVGTTLGPQNDVTVVAEAEDGAPGKVDERQANVDAGSSNRISGAVEPVVWTKREGLLAPPGIATETEITAQVPEGSQRGSDVSVRPATSPTKSLVSRLKLPVRRHTSSDKRSAEKNASRRERKATKTLAIVLGLYQKN